MTVVAGNEVRAVAAAAVVVRLRSPFCTIRGVSEMPISEARDRLGELVSKAEHGYERIVLTRHGRAVAAVISMEDLRDLESAENEADLAAAREALSSTEPHVPHRDVMAEFGLA